MNRVSYNILREMPPIAPQIISDYGFDAEWSQQRERYQAYWDWYDGTVYSRDVARFPLGLNPLRTACQMHRNALFGEPMDSTSPLARVVFSGEALPGDASFGVVDETATQLPEDRKQRIQRAKTLSFFMEQVWGGNAGRAKMSENGLLSQILGGCVFGVRYKPWDIFSPIPISIDLIRVENFLPIYLEDDPWHLVEAWVIKKVNKVVAKSYYGVDTDAPMVNYVEHWTLKDYEILIDDKPASISVGGVVYPLKNKNPYGVIPFVYIPHEREGAFYGVPVMHQMEGMLLEINGRSADLGTAVRDGSHREYWTRNVSRDISVRRVSDHVTAIDLGLRGPGSGNGDPEIKALETPDVPTEAMPFVDKIQDWIRQSANTPDVAYGQDEGSQRSGLTLAFRMWPLSSHINMERNNWATGLQTLSDICLRIAAVKTADEPRLAPYSITDADLNLPTRVDWFSMLPRDAEAETNMTILRHQEGLVSTETAVRAADYIDDPDQEIFRLAQEREAQQKSDQSMLAAKQQGALSDKNPPVATNDTESMS